MTSRAIQSITQALQRTGVSPRTLGILVAVAIACGLALRVLWGCWKFFLRYIVGVKV